MISCSPSSSRYGMRNTPPCSVVSSRYSRLCSSHTISWPMPSGRSYMGPSVRRRCLHLLRAVRLVYAQDCCRDEDGKGGDYVDQDARTVRDLLREAVALDLALVIQTRLHRPFISESHSAIPCRLENRQPDGRNYRIENTHKVSLLGYYVATIKLSVPYSARAS